MCNYPFIYLDDVITIMADNEYRMLGHYIIHSFSKPLFLRRVALDDGALTLYYSIFHV